VILKGFPIPWPTLFLGRAFAQQVPKYGLAHAKSCSSRASLSDLPVHPPVSLLLTLDKCPPPDRNLDLGFLALVFYLHSSGVLRISSLSRTLSPGLPPRLRATASGELFNPLLKVVLLALTYGKTRKRVVVSSSERELRQLLLPIPYPSSLQTRGFSLHCESQPYRTIVDFRCNLSLQSHFSPSKLTE